ncbi:hypothetical protein HMPREF9086_1847 [Enterobacter hormaechei ATCC 49162]|nr:hypothetical protein HMPREF9086_1847 [Enterobacter hormaechei ATCC 49162]
MLATLLQGVGHIHFLDCSADGERIVGSPSDGAFDPTGDIADLVSN